MYESAHVVFLLVGSAIVFLLRHQISESLYNYYQSIYQPTGPWWRNGAWRPSRRTTLWLAYGFSALLFLTGLLAMIYVLG